LIEILKEQIEINVLELGQSRDALVDRLEIFVVVFSVTLASAQFNDELGGQQHE
jgi:hypothetical protein